MPFKMMSKINYQPLMINILYNYPFMDINHLKLFQTLIKNPKFNILNKII